MKSAVFDGTEYSVST